MNKKENWMRLIKNEQPAWIGAPWEAFTGDTFGDIFLGDPIQAAANGVNTPGKLFIDGWGTYWIQQEGSPSATPYITEENKPLKDIREWRKVVAFPPLDGYDWSQAIALNESIDKNEYLTMSFVTGGLFERSHYLMGFEDALCNYMTDGEEMYELLGAIADWKIGQLERIIYYLHPDVIHFHDDWGSKSNLFLPPDIWRTVIKPHHQRIVKYVKDQGALFMHHSDSICGPIVADMADIGIDIWQGAIPQDDIVGIQKRLDGRMAIIGGIDAAIIDMPEVNEMNIRSEVRRCIETYCPQGHFIPCIPNIIPIYPKVQEIYEDELISYGKNYYHRNTKQ